MDPAVELRDVVKAYGGFRALDGLSLRIGKGELYGLLGPNGAGKTTAIRIVTGLSRPTSGEARVLGAPAGSPALRPRVGYMPQETALYQELTVRENLRLFGKLHGIRGAPLAERVDEVLALVDLGKWGDVVMTRLSGGMKHRTSLAAALLPAPELLVLDEPTVGVDPELRASFWGHFDSLRAGGTTILITTHYMDEANRCARVGLVRRGRLVAEDAPAALLSRTRSGSLEDAFLKLARRSEA